MAADPVRALGHERTSVRARAKARHAKLDTFCQSRLTFFDEHTVWRHVTKVEVCSTNVEIPTAGFTVSHCFSVVLLEKDRGGAIG